MFHVLHRFWRWLLARLGYCGGAHFLAGAPSLPPPLTPEQEKALLSRMAAGDAAARDDLITHNLRLVVYLAKKYESSGVPAEDMISGEHLHAGAQHQAGHLRQPLHRQ